MIYQRILKHCKDNNISISAFEKKCNIGNGTIRAWKEGSTPSIKTLKKIEKATGITVAELVKNREE